MTASDDGLRLIDGAHYGKHGPPHELWTRLRRESPMARFEAEGQHLPVRYEARATPA